MYRARPLYLAASLISLAIAVWMLLPEDALVRSAEREAIEPEKRQTVEPQEKQIRGVRLPTDGPGLVEFLRRLSPSDVPPERIEQLIAQLGSPRFAERDRASKELVAVGISVLPALKKALNSSDREVVRRAQACMRDIIPPEAVRGLPLEAVRGLVRLRPPGAVEALLRYLPNAADESLEEEIWYGLDSLTVNKGKVDPVLVAALNNVVPVRRAAAACIVGRRGNEEQRAEVRKLLADADPMVRLRAAQGLLAAKDKTAIPVLVALLDQPSVALAWQAEELLHWVAGDKAPEATVGSGAALRRAQCRKAWETWWRQQGAEVDLAKLDKEPCQPGLVLIWTNNLPDEGHIYLFGCDGKPRWQLDNVSEPAGAQLLPGDRLLVVERSPFRVTQRELEGKIVWQEQRPLPFPPLSYQPLPNGNVFLANRTSAAELSPEGRAVYMREHFLIENKAVVGKPHRLSNGHVLCCSDINLPGQGPSLELLAEFDPATGHIVRKVRLEQQDKRIGRYSIEALPNGNYLIMAVDPGRVFEVDATGKTVWQYTVSDGMGQAIRLRNGNTLISRMNGRGGRLVEIDRAGRMVGEVFTECPFFKFRLCLNLVRLGFDTPRPGTQNLAKSVPHRLKGLESKHPLMRYHAALQLKELGPKAAAAVPALIEALDDPDAQVRGAAWGALAAVGPQVIPDLIKALEDKRPNVRAGVIRTLGQFSREARVAVPSLIEALKDESVLVRRNAAYVFGRIGPEAKGAVPALALALNDKDRPTDRTETCVAYGAACSLADIGPEAQAAVPALIEALNTKDVRLQVNAIHALAQIGPGAKAAVLPLMNLLQDKKIDRSARRLVFIALGSIGPEASAAIPVLQEALNDPDDLIRPEVSKALKAIRR